MPNITLHPGALYLVLWGTRWQMARYVKRDEWRWPESNLLVVPSPTEIGQEVLEIEWTRDPFMPAWEISAMVKHWAGQQP